MIPTEKEQEPKRYSIGRPTDLSLKITAPITGHICDSISFYYLICLLFVLFAVYLVFFLFAVNDTYICMRGHNRTRQNKWLNHSTLRFLALVIASVPLIKENTNPSKHNSSWRSVNNSSADSSILFVAIWRPLYLLIIANNGSTLRRSERTCLYVSSINRDVNGQQPAWPFIDVSLTSHPPPPSPCWLSITVE